MTLVLCNRYVVDGVVQPPPVSAPMPMEKVVGRWEIGLGGGCACAGEGSGRLLRVWSGPVLDMIYDSLLSFGCVRIGFGPAVVGTGSMFCLGRVGAWTFALHSGW